MTRVYGTRGCETGGGRHARDGNMTDVNTAAASDDHTTYAPAAPGTSCENALLADGGRRDCGDKQKIRGEPCW